MIGIVGDARAPWPARSSRSSSAWKRMGIVAAASPRSKPSSVIATAQPLLTPPTTSSFGHDGVGVEDLVELALAGDHLDRPHLDAGLAHVDEQERDALVLGRVGIGAGEREDVVGEVPGRGPDLLAVEHPLVAVEHGPQAEVGEVGCRRWARSSPGTTCPRRRGCAAGSAPSARRCPTAAACCRASGCRTRRSGRRSARRPWRTPRR